MLICIPSPSLGKVSRWIICIRGCTLNRDYRGIQRLQGNTGTKGENRDYKGVPGLWGKLRLQGDKGTGGN